MNQPNPEVYQPNPGAGLYSESEEDRDGNIASLTDAVFDAGRRIEKALELLGNADAATPMGAIEGLGLCVKEAGDRIGNGLESIAAAIEELARTFDNNRAEGG